MSRGVALTGCRFVLTLPNNFALSATLLKVGAVLMLLLKDLFIILCSFRGESGYFDLHREGTVPHFETTVD